MNTYPGVFVRFLTDVFISVRIEKPPLPADTQDEQTPADATPPVKRKSKYIPFNELLRRTFNVELKCANCKGDLRLIALIKTAATIKKILAAMGLPTLPPAAAPGTGSGPSHADGVGGAPSGMS